jgi:hypothetical protein
LREDNFKNVGLARQVQRASVNPPSQCVRESGISRRDMFLKLYETNFRREDYGDLPKGRDCISSGCRPTRGTNSGWSYELHRLEFLQVYETLGEAMVDEHLAYEIEKYARKNCATATSRISIYFSSPMNRAARRHAVMLVGYRVSRLQSCRVAWLKLSVGAS